MDEFYKTAIITIYCKLKVAFLWIKSAEKVNIKFYKLVHKKLWNINKLRDVVLQAPCCYINSPLCLILQQCWSRGSVSRNRRFMMLLKFGLPSLPHLSHGTILLLPPDLCLKGQCLEIFNLFWTLGQNQRIRRFLKVGGQNFTPWLLLIMHLKIKYYFVGTNLKR